MAGNLMRKGRFGEDMQGRWPCNDGGRDVSFPFQLLPMLFEEAKNTWIKRKNI